MVKLVLNRSGWRGVLLGAGALALTLGGCATKTRTGAAVGGTTGAVLGAGVGAISGGNKGAIIGAGVGAAAGAGAGALIGRYMDKQEKALKKDVKGATIERNGDQLLVRFDEAILFDLNEAELKAKSQDDLREFAGVLKQYDQTNLVIEGHTDSTGPDDYNERLSWLRARAVMEFLESQGVHTERMAARGYADKRPVADNSTSDGRRQNRRVQVQIAANEELKRQDAQATKNAQAPTRATSDQRNVAR